MLVLMKLEVSTYNPFSFLPVSISFPLPLLNFHILIVLRYSA